MAIERIAYEACQDQASQGVIYFEARYSPHLLSNTIPTFYVEHPLSIDDPKAVTPDDVVLAVQRGFHRGQSQFGVKVRHIMCSIKKMNWTVDCVALAARHRSFVVAIDLAGNEDNEYTEDEITGFQTAAELNIHRTVHAGESGPAENVQRALSTLYAERIGKGGFGEGGRSRFSNFSLFSQAMVIMLSRTRPFTMNARSVMFTLKLVPTRRV